jgi:hypothetical protein
MLASVGVPGTTPRPRGGSTPPCPKRPGRRAWCKEVVDLLGIHGDAGVKDDVTQVGHRALAERALGLLHEQVVVLQLRQHEVDTAKFNSFR